MISHVTLSTYVGSPLKPASVVCTWVACKTWTVFGTYTNPQGPEAETPRGRNPANEEVTIEYQCISEGTIELYNAQGQLLYKTLLPKGNSSTKITLPILAIGVYNYKCEFEACKKYYGLLTILK
jgi:hypothetical protein